MRADYRSAIDTHTTGRIRGVSSGAGVAKTTLAQRFKARALKDGNSAMDSFVPIVSEDSSEALAGQVLVAVYRSMSFDDIPPTLLQQYADHLVL